MLQLMNICYVFVRSICTTQKFSFLSDKRKLHIAWKLLTNIILYNIMEILTNNLKLCQVREHVEMDANDLICLQNVKIYLQR